jgi:hypothetical protein
MLTRFLPKFDKATDLIFRDLKQSKQALWTVRFSQVMAGRKLFRTEQNRSLGTGPQSLKVGDLVCLLAGGSVPYLIRPVDGAQVNEFRFIGEAYIHGIMHGQAVRAEGAMVQAIILI